MRDIIRQSLNLILAVGQLLLPPLWFATGFNEGTAATPPIADPNPATPAGYAFAVWGAIYLGAATYAVVQALPRNREDPFFRRVGWWTVIGYTGCCVWLYFASFGPVWATVPVIVVMILSLGRAFVVASDLFYAEKTWQRLITVVPLSIYAGWISAATFVNFADVIPAYGFDRFGMSGAEFGRLVVLMAGGTAFAFALRTKAFPVYIGTVVWALVGIIVANGGTAFDNPIAWISAGAALVLIAMAFWFRPARLAVGAMRKAEPQ